MNDFYSSMSFVYFSHYSLDEHISVLDVLCTWHASIWPFFISQCVYQHLATVKRNNNNASVVISTKFSLTIQVESQNRNVTLCR